MKFIKGQEISLLNWMLEENADVTLWLVTADKKMRAKSFVTEAVSISNLKYLFSNCDIIVSSKEEAEEICRNTITLYQCDGATFQLSAEQIPNGKEIAVFNHEDIKALAAQITGLLNT